MCSHSATEHRRLRPVSLGACLRQCICDLHALRTKEILLELFGEQKNMLLLRLDAMNHRPASQTTPTTVPRQEEAGSSGGALCFRGPAATCVFFAK